ncbi:MAG: EcsC protein family protein [Hydrocarboniphaga sp.]|uniref:EcsC family protein n=1 Tax=Hydrocarboniphaga sp. TaxID=2033016 RepID=UPI00261B60CA|nr:EcsC family protein [Hydrocarboniphaga sp.]MDB5968250.1 EcsC protein family protein [Hydrocarboniphaga sp.]
MDEYERSQLLELRRWQEQAPAPVTRWFGRAAGPASQAVQTIIPTAALRIALDGVQSTAGRFAGHATLLKQARVARIEDLRNADLQRCDQLAAKVRRRSCVTAGGTGALLGVAGGAGMVADIPTLMVLAFRTIQRIGLCYGEVLHNVAGRQLGLAIFALASANTVEEKRTALLALTRPEPGATREAAWRDGIERAAERELAKEAAMLSIQNLAMQAGRHLGWRKAAGALPVFGALVGGSVNAWYLWDLATVSRYCFQERWLRNRHRELHLQASMPALPPEQQALPAPNS